MVKAKCKKGSAIQIWNDRSPQGYSYRFYGKPSRKMVDLEGIALVKILRKKDKFN